MFVLSSLVVNGDRLNCNLNELAEIGKQPSGSICRLAFSSEDIQARHLVEEWMIQAGMKVRIDAAGNLIGRYHGLQDDAPALATGSHIDTVPTGGCFDGVLGVLAGIETVRTLAENNIRLHHPLDVIVFTDEESTMVGAQAMAGTILLDFPERYQTKLNLPIQDALTRVGGDWSKISTAKRSRSDIAAFVELHVEQGAVLETCEKQIGIVQGVVGMHRKLITITGKANHAGTTPMNRRQDALIAASKLTLAVQQIALKMPTEPVATVGYLNVLPNAVNIIPGQVELSVDLRDLSQKSLEQMLVQLEEKIEEIATETKTKIEIKSLLGVLPSLASVQVQATMEMVCQQLQLSYCSLPSRAGHDSLELGRITDMGMIFVPSQEGISHSEAEYTSPEQCTQGANVLLHTLIELDRIYSELK